MSTISIFGSLNDTICDRSGLSAQRFYCEHGNHFFTQIKAVSMNDNL